MIVYFHIGTHKTGTTSIQSLLHDNKDRLLNSGVLYPGSGCTKTNAHHNLVYESVGSWKYKPAFGGWANLEKEVSDSGCKNVVLSAENFSGYYKDDRVISDVLLFCKKLGAKPVIVVTIRPQVEYIDSIYSQNCATGYEPRKYDEFLLSCLSDPAFDYEVLLGRWFDNFSDVRVLDYTKFSNDGGFSSFFSAIGCDFLFSSLRSSRPLNSRRSAHVVEFCRKASEILTKKVALKSDQKHKIVAEVSSLTAKHFMESKPFVGIGEETYELANDVFSLKNDEFFKSRLVGRSMFEGSSSRYAGISFNEKSVFDIDSSGSQCIDAFMEIYTHAVIKVLQG